MTAASRILKILRRYEWQDLREGRGRLQCRYCRGFAPGDYRLSNESRDIYEPRGHTHDCEIALAIQDAGGIVVWRDFWQGEVPVDKYAGLTLQEAFDRVWLDFLLDPGLES